MSWCLCGKKIVLEYFHRLVTIEYFRLNIEYLRNSSRREPLGRTIHFKKDGATRGASACAARATSTNIQFAIFNLQFRLVQVRVFHKQVQRAPALGEVGQNPCLRKR